MPPSRALALITALALSACASAPHPHAAYAGPVVVANADDMRPCQLLDELGGSSGLTGLFGPQGVENIKQHLLRQADALGATHVVWGKPSVGYDSTTLKAQAYKCPPTAR